ncbi:MAG: hypothetical protein COA78_17915 [Blastopirellula sp.]|nr:MAG: hypothetical protein COA78_17915 [Blastopirellula sp.]
MTANQEGFPEPRDLAIQNEAEELMNFSESLADWIGRFGPERIGTSFEIDSEDEFQLLSRRRLASNLFNSSKVPVAAAVYGASQVGKSLFMSRVLDPVDDRDSPLGKCDTLSPDAYLRELSFENDINPESGSNEATALVTRFTTKDRFDPEALPGYPVKVKTLSRSEWMRVLARGFRSECPSSEVTWEEGQIRDLFETAAQTYGAEKGIRDWQMDLIDTYSYLRGLAHRQYSIKEEKFNSYLSLYPLTEAGYVEVASKLFWDSTQNPEIRLRLTELFNEVRNFISKVRKEGKDGILIHWGAARFLLDSQRQPQQINEFSKWKKELHWTDFTNSMNEGWYVIDYQPGGRGTSDDLSIIQSAMLEMVMPVIPHRLNGDWREVVKKMDILDLPGMVAGGGDSGGKSNVAQSMEEKMMIVKRGKVFYLIERYIEEKQVQTLLLLMRGGNAQVRQLLKEYIDKWGKSLYGKSEWPQGVQATTPPLFIGMTGIDEETRERKQVDLNMFKARLNNIVEHTLCEVMKDFGGPGKPLTNVYPIRYPGTWDWNTEQRKEAKYGGESRWDELRKVFLDTDLVQTYVRDPEKRWDAAMQDDDGGMSLICSGFRKCTSSEKKQQTLEEQVQHGKQTVRNLAKSWYTDPDSNADRNNRIGLANRVLEWLTDEETVYERVFALESSLCFNEGNTMELAEFADTRTIRSKKSIEERFPQKLHEFLKEWATVSAPQRWQDHVSLHSDKGSWLNQDDFGTLTAYLSDYLRSDAIFSQLNKQLLRIITLRVSDQGARKLVMREYVQLVLNDYVMNPGPSTAALDPSAGVNGADLGLMKPLVQRWHQRLPLALASAAGTHTEIPSGNAELKDLLTFYKQ